MYRVVVDAAVDAQVLARFGHALADPTRARILLALREAPGYPADLADLAGVSRQSLSNHLACLRERGLVIAVPEGRRTRYQLADPRLVLVLGDLLASLAPLTPAGTISGLPAPTGERAGSAGGRVRTARRAGPT